MTPEQLHDQRERMLAQIETMGTLPKSFRTTVVGVSFIDAYPNNLKQLEEMNLWALFSDERIPCVLIPNPHNKHDANAVEIHVPALGEAAMVGHLTRPVAARVAKELSEGNIWIAHVDSVRVDPDHPDRPGLEIHLQRKAA